MTDAVLFGYENQENLGLRSLVAYLGACGRRALLAPFRGSEDPEALALVSRVRPRVVGFSLIFQHTIDEFGRLMRYLRSNGVVAHFTAGGHFPSLRPEEALTLLPELDSIVRFEGEDTLLELLSCVDQPERWDTVRGLAFRRDGGVSINAPRPLVQDLDALPPVHRDETRLAAAGVPMAAMLASRGCLYNCSFCSIREFYGSSPGARRRVRSPSAVVAELRTLADERGVRYFSFQDDDFAAKTAQQRDWLDEFLHCLERAGLADSIRWKISCRVDDLESDLLRRMQDHGLMAVYLGIESGNQAGLRTLNKQVSVDQNLAAIALLKQHRVSMAIGFMLFDPSSTADSVRENIGFLRAVGEDGYFPINFCKMLPYAGTRIEKELREAGRLKGTVLQPDYGFLDQRLDWYEALVKRVFSRRNFGQEGLVARLQQLDFSLHLAEAFGRTAQRGLSRPEVRALVRDDNLTAVQTLSDLLGAVESQEIDALLADGDRLAMIAERQWRGEMRVELALRRASPTASDQLLTSS